MKTVDERVNEIIREYPSASAEYIESVLRSEGYEFIPGWVIV